MKKSAVFIVFTATLALSASCFGITLHSMSKNQIKQALVNKTCAVNTLNGRAIDNAFSIFMSDQGTILGKMARKPVNEPQADKGTYLIKADGTLYITWQHWDDAKKVCLHIFNFQNAYISVDCDNAFHIAFMKDAIQSGNHL